MPDVGSHPGSWNSFQFSGLNTFTEVSVAATMPADGTISSVSCFVGGDGGSVNAQFAIWRQSDGALLASTSTFSLGSGSRSSGGQSWVTQSLSSPLFVANGTGIYIGWYRDPSGGAVWSMLTAGSFLKRTETGSLGSFTSPTTDSGGQLGAYATYTTGPPPVRNLKVAPAGSWVDPGAIEQTGAAVTAVKVSVSGTWTTVWQ